LAAEAESAPPGLDQTLERLEAMISAMTQMDLPIGGVDPAQTPPQGDWMEVIAPNQKAIHIDGNLTQDVEVLGHRYTPHGLMYQLHSANPGVAWMVRAGSVKPIFGQTRMIEVNLVTGEIR
jgi:hypothetical protein